LRTKFRIAATLLACALLAALGLVAAWDTGGFGNMLLAAPNSAAPRGLPPAAVDA
jgi:hypothetical protein